MSTENTASIYDAILSSNTDEYSAGTLILVISQAHQLGLSKQHLLVRSGAVSKDLTWLYHRGVGQYALDHAIAIEVAILERTGARPDRMIWKRVMSSAIFESCPSEILRRSIDSQVTGSPAAGWTRIGNDD